MLPNSSRHATQLDTAARKPQHEVRKIALQDVVFSDIFRGTRSNISLISVSILNVLSFVLVHPPLKQRTLMACLIYNLQDVPYGYYRL